MGTKIKRHDGKEQEVDPQDLFDRLINLSLVWSSSQVSESERLNLKDILCYELSPFPAMLFESEYLMLQSDKPQITNALKKNVEPQASEKAPIINGVHVVDGGSLLYRIPWSKRTKFENIAKSYVKYVKDHFLSPNCSAKIVFDSYPTVPTTKDSTHLRRNKEKCTNISITKHTILDVSKAKFLSNQSNKQRFVNFIITHLEKVCGISCIQANDDADVLIVKTAVNCLRSSDVTVFGEDTDLMALLLHYKDQLLETSHQLFMHTKVVNWNLKQLIEQLEVEDHKNFLKYILVLHSLSGCDTTSRIFGKGK